ncbi:translation initiation factor IF-1A [Candidatus Pacearchaeota archaeon CG10_big_fil_rev_8_21_14_0_10_35_13]|nr:MAG: translation initiation factor IF-1A [Candidatus Pacearchaeota archaeon CG10_big_fil_rev_8_21_14_0_10_35_13]
MGVPRFKNKSKKNKAPDKKPGSFGDVPQTVSRARIPRNGEVIGRVEQRFGGSKMLVKCSDGKERNCRVPGRMRRKLWLREGDIILIEPWEFESDSRGDIIFKYRPAEVDWLVRSNNLDKSFMEEF